MKSQAAAILSIHNASVSFNNKPIFESLSFNIHENDRIALVGRNGAGKTTLMRMITGDKELDEGERWEEPGITIGYMQQDNKPNPQMTVFEYIHAGLKPEKQTEEYNYMVDMVLEPFELHAEDKMGSLSGGQIRRACLARSLVEEPDILLLDEPTNHLDLFAIEWLEEYLNSYRGTIMCISHDKAFLANITNKIFWLDRGNIRVCPRGFGNFDEWSAELLEQEARELAKFKKQVAQEVEWASRGVKARRKRNIKRLEDMKKAREKLKADVSSYNQATRKIEYSPVESVAAASKAVAEFINVSKFFEEDHVTKNILNKFSIRIQRKDRIGIIGKNGSGKTSFLKMLIGEIKPDAGKIKVARNLTISYFDQKRSDLVETDSLWKTLCPNGGDYIEVGDKTRHVCGYLKDFMFDPAIAREKVSTLSGGQKNRLMLAKILANPGDFLILDEPTNDLDMDSLDMLEEILSAYQGTLFVVSHDRDFLDQTVSKTLAFEGDGKVDLYVGGYSDYMEASGKKAKLDRHGGENIKEKGKVKEEIKKKQKAKKLSYKLQYEYDNLPEKIKILENEIENLNAILSDANLYINDVEKFNETTEKLEKAKSELDEAEIRWLEIDEMISEKT